MNAVRMPDGSLARATGAAGNDVFRGDRLPKDMIGDYFYGEVVARIVRRLHPVKTEGLTQLRNVYPLSEFIRSTDPLFRPVDVTTAPDGTMYITDMYRGIIQESQWSGPGTYLRQRIDQYGARQGRAARPHLAADVRGHGRRTDAPQHADRDAGAARRASRAMPNGWWRDTAQQLLVLKQDKSVVPALKQLARRRPNQLARIHALWTLEGLASADAALRPRADEGSAIRRSASRRFAPARRSTRPAIASLAADYKALAKDADTDVVDAGGDDAEHAEGGRRAGDDQGGAGRRTRPKACSSSPATILNPPATRGPRRRLERDRRHRSRRPSRRRSTRAQAIYKEVCFACHGDDGRGEPMPGGARGRDAGARACVVIAAGHRATRTT